MKQVQHILFWFGFVSLCVFLPAVIPGINSIIRNREEIHHIVSETEWRHTSQTLFNYLDVQEFLSQDGTTSLRLSPQMKLRSTPHSHRVHTEAKHFFLVPENLLSCLSLQHKLANSDQFGHWCIELCPALTKYEACGIALCLSSLGWKNKDPTIQQPSTLHRFSARTSVAVYVTNGHE